MQTHISLRLRSWQAFTLLTQTRTVQRDNSLGDLLSRPFFHGFHIVSEAPAVFLETQQRPSQPCRISHKALSNRSTSSR